MKRPVVFRTLVSGLLLLSSLNGADVSVRLENAKKAIESSDEIEQFRGYNECKTIHLRANLDKNPALAKEALDCIVHGGEKLGVDVGKYLTERAKLQTESSKANEESKTVAQSAAAATPTAEPKTTELFAKVPDAVYDKTFKPVQYAARFATPEPEKLQKNEPTKKSDDIGMSQRHRLVDAVWKDAGLELLFDSPVQQSEIRLSKILEPDKERFRYIVDIDLGTLSKSQTLEHKSINRIKIAQYDAKTLRLVFEHNRPVAIKPIARGSSIYIDLNLEPPKATPPLATAPVQPVVVQEPPLIAALPPLITVTPRDRSKKVIVIDPGHGGKDGGAAGNGFAEKEIVLQIGLKFAEQLRSMGYTVYMTRPNDTFIELKDRTKFANDKQADLFISIHANSIPKTSDPAGAQGLETYFLSPGRSERAMRIAAIENSEDMGEMGQYGKLSFLDFINKAKIIESNKLAIDLQKGILGNLRKQFPHVRDNGVREAPFWVLVGAQMPAVLVEVGYISHPEESARIADEKYQKWMVEGLVEGVGRYFANNS